MECGGSPPLATASSILSSASLWRSSPYIHSYCWARERALFSRASYLSHTPPATQRPSVAIASLIFLLFESFLSYKAHLGPRWPRWASRHSFLSLRCPTLSHMAHLGRRWPRWASRCSTLSQVAHVGPHDGLDGPREAPTCPTRPI